MDLALWFDDGVDLNLVMDIAEQLAEPLNFEIAENHPVITRNNDYFEVTVAGYSEEQFKEHFRMSRVSFFILCEIVGNRMGNRASKIDFPKKVLLTIYIMSKPVSFLEAGDKFGMSGGTAHYIFKEIVETLASLVNEYIVWPHQLHVNDNTFRERSRGFPKVVGIIDGCHIPIKQPVGNANDFFNRHEGHSIILQGVCDHNLKFIDIFIGLPGRMHDARVFRNSPLFQNLMNNLIPENYHILGDSAYPLLPNILTPYRDNGHLNEIQRNYNIKLSSIRSTIERAFALLKGKFRRLKYLDIENLELANNIIAAGCVLHNFLINQGDIDINFTHDNEDNEIIEVPDAHLNIFGVGNRQEGERKRNVIANDIYQNV